MRNVTFFALIILMALASPAMAKGKAPGGSNAFISASPKVSTLTPIKGNTLGIVNPYAFDQVPAKAPKVKKAKKGS